MTDLSRLEADILELSSDVSPDRYLDLLMKVEVLAGNVKAMRVALEEKGIEIIEAHGGKIECGETVYVVGRDKTYKPRISIAQTAEQLMLLLGGDWKMFCDCLSSAAIKHGQVRTYLEGIDPAKFDELFQTIIKKTIEGKPIKRVKAIPSHMLERTVTP
jgi:hypothetical protein